MSELKYSIKILTRQHFCVNIKDMLIKKDNLTIRPAEASDASLLGAWWRDSLIAAEWGCTQNLTISDEKVEKQILSCSDDSFRLLIIEIGGKPSGEMNYHNMGGGIAQIGINICDFSMRNKGYGTELLLMLTEKLFKEKGFTRVILEVDVKNAPARRAYEKAGFREKKIRHDNSVAEYELINNYSATSNL